MIEREESDLLEYLIKRTDGDWFDLTPELFESSLHPNSVPYEKTDGPGHHRIRIQNGEIEFNDEMPGVHVIFERFLGTSDQAFGLVKEFLQNIQRATGQRGVIICIEGDAPIAVY